MKRALCVCVCAVLSTTGSCPTLGPRLGAHGVGNESRMDPTTPSPTAAEHLGLNLAPDLPHSSSQTGTTLIWGEQIGAAQR